MMTDNNLILSMMFCIELPKDFVYMLHLGLCELVLSELIDMPDFKDNIFKPPVFLVCDLCFAHNFILSAKNKCQVLSGFRTQSI